MYTTNPIEHSSAATEHPTSESDLESPVESHRTLAEHSTDLLGGILQMILNHISLVERSVAAAERLLGLVV